MFLLRLIHQAFFTRDNFLCDEAFLLKFGKRAVDLALVGRQKMTHRLVKSLLQIVA